MAYSYRSSKGCCLPNLSKESWNGPGLSLFWGLRNYPAGRSIQNQFCRSPCCRCLVFLRASPLQAAVGAREGLSRKTQRKILGSITLQHYFNLYPAIGGMTGMAQSVQRSPSGEDGLSPELFFVSEEGMKGFYFIGCARKCASVSSATNFGCSSTMK